MEKRNYPAPLSRGFYAKDTVKVARGLLGKRIVRIFGGKLITGRITETEAYIGEHDPAAHSFGRVTPRNSIMYGPPGFAYVYFIYGKYFCFNAVTGPEGEGNAVLIRAAEITEGEEAARRLRNYRGFRHGIANGPAKLCMALGIDGSQNGTDLTAGGDLYIASGSSVKEEDIAVSARIGITKGAGLPYRFFVKGNPGITVHRFNK